MPVFIKLFNLLVCLFLAVHTNGHSSDVFTRKLSILSRRFLLSENEKSYFLSVTINTELFPVQGEMTTAQQTIFETGMISFLNMKLENEARNYGLSILSSTISRHELIANSHDENDEPEKLLVQSVISAQQITSGEAKSKLEFGRMIVNLVDLFDDNLLDTWKQSESVANLMTEGMEFNLLQNVKPYIYLPEDGQGGTKFGAATIIVGITAAILTLGAVISIIREKRNEQSILTEPIGYAFGDPSKSHVGSNKNLHEILKRNISEDDVSFVPYSDVHLEPPRRQRKNKYTKLTTASKSAEDFEFGITFSKSEDEFEDDLIKKSKSKSEILTDGSAMKGIAIAPAGKLGVAIDTVNGRSVVHRVREDSPLHGVLRRLDIIVAVDEVDTTFMSAADVTSLMAQRMSNSRTISYLRGSAVKESLRKAAN